MINILVNTHQWLQHHEVHLREENSYIFLQGIPYLFHKMAKEQLKANFQYPESSRKEENFNSVELTKAVVI